MYNIIFLDIDGVLNGYTFLNTLGWKFVCFTKSKKLQNWYRNITDPSGVHESKVKRLSKLVKQTNSKVVMSSTWRHFFWNTPYEEKTDRQKKLQDLLNKYNIEVIGITPSLQSNRREDEIIFWLSNNQEKVKKYIILDDEKSDLTCFENSNLIQTVTYYPRKFKRFWIKDTGLTNKHVKKAIEYINKR